MKRLTRVLAVFVSGLLVSACTLVPTDSHPKVVDPAAVPSGLLNGKNQNRVVTVTVWFIASSGSLKPVTMHTTSQPDVGTLISLLSGRHPWSLHTAVPRNWEVTRAVLNNTNMRITLKGASSLTATLRAQSGAQLVETLHDAYGVVTLELRDGEAQYTYRSSRN